MNGFWRFRIRRKAEILSFALVPLETRINPYQDDKMARKAKIFKKKIKKIPYFGLDTHAVVFQAFVVGDWQFNWNSKMDVYTKALANAFANAFTDSEITFRRHFAVSSVNVSRSVQTLLRKRPN